MILKNLGLFFVSHLENIFSKSLASTLTFRCGGKPLASARPLRCSSLLSRGHREPRRPRSSGGSVCASVSVLEAEHTFPKGFLIWRRRALRGNPGGPSHPLFGIFVVQDHPSPIGAMSWLAVGTQVVTVTEGLGSRCKERVSCHGLLLSPSPRYSNILGFRFMKWGSPSLSRGGDRLFSSL